MSVTPLPTKAGQMILVTEYGGLYDAAKPIPAYLHGGDWYRVDGEPWPGNDGYLEGPAHEITGWEPLNINALPQRNAQMDAVLKLHKPHEDQLIGGNCAEGACDHEEDCPTVPFMICTECARMAEEIDSYYGETGVDEIAYPCPTVRAIESAQA